MTEDQQELVRSTDKLNERRALEIEDNNIASINDQVNELQENFDENLASIRKMQVLINELTDKNVGITRQMELLRQQRSIFAHAAFELRQLQLP